MDGGSGVLIVVPAWNEAASVGLVVREALAAVPGASVLVVDDGSVDRTATVAAGAGATVICNATNLGVGGAVQVGMRYGLEHGFRAVVQVDADGQHDPADIPALLAPLRSDERPHVVIGTRFAGRGTVRVPPARRLVMAVLARRLSRMTGTTLSDVTSGYRAHNRAALVVFARSYPARYLSDTVESLVVASRSGATLTQVPVGMRARHAGRPSQSRGRAAAAVARVLVAVALDAERWHRPGRPGAGGAAGRAPSWWPAPSLTTRSPVVAPSASATSPAGP